MGYYIKPGWAPGEELTKELALALFKEFKKEQNYKALVELLLKPIIESDDSLYLFEDYIDEEGESEKGDDSQFEWF